jgi:hypothetical protein
MIVYYRFKSSEEETIRLAGIELLLGMGRKNT